MDIRARGLEANLGPGFESRRIYRQQRGPLGVARVAAELARFDADVDYLLDLGYVGFIGGVAHRLSRRRRLIVDTGDAMLALVRSTRMRGALGTVATGALEYIGHRAADALVVRGRGHQELLAAQGLSSEWIPDGVDLQAFARQDAEALRRKLGLENQLVVTVLGSSQWSAKLGICYGWELVECLRELREQPVVGLMIGDGSGIRVLEERAREHRLSGRIRFVGRIAHEELAPYLWASDVCLSTQSNDVVGAVRTTGKLPLYLAAGCYVLASDVGEASRVLPPSMRVPYEGVVDLRYPHRLAKRLSQLLENPEQLLERSKSAAIAAEHFDYRRLGARVASLVRREVGLISRPTAGLDLPAQ